MPVRSAMSFGVLMASKYILWKSQRGKSSLLLMAHELVLTSFVCIRMSFSLRMLRMKIIIVENCVRYASAAMEYWIGKNATRESGVTQNFFLNIFCRFLKFNFKEVKNLNKIKGYKP